MWQCTISNAAANIHVEPGMSPNFLLHVFLAVWTFLHSLLTWQNSVVFYFSPLSLSMCHLLRYCNPTTPHEYLFISVTLSYHLNLYIVSALFIHFLQCHFSRKMNECGSFCFLDLYCLSWRDYFVLLYEDWDCRSKIHLKISHHAIW